VAHYLTDFVVGDSFETGAIAVDESAALEFARAYDPQPFHLDRDAAASSIFGGLTVSGWLTAALTMRLVVDSGILRETGIVGTGIDDLRWLAAVRPGDTLRVRGEVVGTQPWSDGRRGTLRVKLLTLNQDGVVVMSQIANLLLPVSGAS